VTKVFGHLDPRTRILAVLCAIIIVVSTPPGVLPPFAAYFALIILLVLTSRASGIYLTWRCLAASPFILLASILLAFEGGLLPDGTPAASRAALSVALKGYSAAILLALLTATTDLSELLLALRRLKAPDSLSMILGMMYRYTGLLSEEYARMERARDCRTVNPLGRRRFGVHGRQLGELILRSWDRAERIHAAMLARGFTGVWPAPEQQAFRALDWVFLFATGASFMSARLLA
jgi:cobalt/nickel transport system permease protein